jgi:hypothetical protein
LQKQKERKIVSLAGSFEVLQTSNQLTAKAVSHRPLRGFPAAKPLGRSLTGTFCPAFEKAGQNKGAAPIEKHV